MSPLTRGFAGGNILSRGYGPFGEMIEVVKGFTMRIFRLLRFNVVGPR